MTLLLLRGPTEQQAPLSNLTLKNVKYALKSSGFTNDKAYKLLFDDSSEPSLTGDYTKKLCYQFIDFSPHSSKTHLWVFEKEQEPSLENLRNQIILKAEVKKCFGASASEQSDVIGSFVLSASFVHRDIASATIVLFHLPTNRLFYYELET